MLNIEFWSGVSCLAKWSDAHVVPSVGHQVLLGTPPIGMVVLDVFWYGATDVHVLVALKPLSIVGVDEEEINDARTEMENDS